MGKPKVIDVNAVFTVAALADFLCVPIETIEEAVASGQLPHKSLDGGVLITGESVLRWLDGRERLKNKPRREPLFYRRR